MNRLKIKRKSEMWVSNNRVLLGSSRKDPGRNPNFDTEETNLLITLWGDPKVQKTLITSHRKHAVIAKIAEKLNQYGYHRSTQEINTRIKNLKCFYNRLKKDIDMGMTSRSTWKHYDAMDEIMNRSIFSVRPNEVPKPSLKYQMEMGLKECEERRQSSGKENDITGGSDAHMQYDEDEEKPAIVEACRGWNGHSDDDTNESLLVPKDEPVDLDSDVEVECTDDQPNKSADDQPQKGSLQIPNSVSITTASTNPVCHMPNTNGNISTTLSSSTSSTSSATITPSIVFTNKPKPMPPTGKISLVPTNFLLQQNAQQTPQIQIRPQPQPRIICSQPNLQPNITTAGPNRMKVLLVNAFQNGNTPNNTVPKEPIFSNPNLLTTTNILKSNMPDVTPTMKNNVETTKHTKTDETPLSKDPGIEMLFNKLIVMQHENNEIQKQRMELERQRFEFEKSIAEKLLAAFTSLTPVQNRDFVSFPITVESSASVEVIPTERTRTMGIADGFQLMTPKLERED